MAVSDVIVLLLTLLVFIGFFSWMFYIIYWILKKFNVWKKLKYRKLKKKFGESHEFNEEIVLWSKDLLNKGLGYYDVKKLAKYQDFPEEYLYTFLVFEKLNSERRLIL